ncbi:MAG: hypothetical protein GY947_18050 [Rhodobacteraceae bacterium]|nr:hypothetical protein [Paracoccaceae bacterium]
MNRREFARSLAAAAAVPALPGKAIAALAAPVAEAAGSRFRDPYSWAEFISRVHNQSSPEMLHRLLKLPIDEATGLYNRLLNNKVIAPTNAYGFSRAINPFPRAPIGMVSSDTTASSQALKPKNQASKALVKDSDSDAQDADSPPVNHPVADLGDDSAADPLVSDPAENRTGSD